MEGGWGVVSMWSTASGDWGMTSMEAHQTAADETCMAAVPVMRRSLTGHLVGGDPVIDHESAVRDWAECGEPAAAVHVYRCGHGHEKRRPTCAEHAPQPGQVGCRDCYDQGHECGMTAERVKEGGDDE
jgi:hypothetical protein